MKFQEIVKHRYATKAFNSQRVPNGLIKELQEIIRLAPSSLNIQPWKIKVITSAELKEKLAPAAWNQTQITTCSHLLVFCAETNLQTNINKLEKAMPDAKEYLDMAKNFAKGMNPEQTLAWSQRQLYLALSNGINGAKALGFDSCPMEGFDPTEFSKILDLPKHLHPTALCALGYGIDKPHPKFRFPTEEVFF